MRLTTNGAAPAPVLERITINIGGGKVRKETLEGRPHLVVPTVLLREEVLNGSSGPIFYPHDENTRDVDAWNHMPIVVDHPEVDGTPVSARTPDVLNSRKVGVVLNAAGDDTTKKVTAECWFDEALLKSTDVRVYNNVLKEVPTESSTGLFLLPDPTAGKYGDTPYNAVARSQKPDHLAVLPDKVGALSIKMGGGLFANAEKEPEAHRAVEQRTAANALKAVGIEFVGNELSFNTITRQLSDVLARTHGEKGQYWEGWVEDVFPDYVVFRTGGKTMKQEYSANDKGVSLKGAATEVVRTVSYSPVANSAAANPKESLQMNKTLFVNWLIANCGYTEADRARLEALPDADLQAVKPVVANGTPAPTPTPPPTVTIPTPTGPVTVTREALQAAMDPADVAVLNYGRQQLAATRTMLVNALKATGRCKFTDKYLNDLPLPELQAMVEMAGGQTAVPTTNGGPSPFVPGYVPGMPVPHAAGQFHPAGVFGGHPFPPFGFPAPAGPVANYGLQNGGTVPTGNAKKDDADEDDDVLEPPVVNFKKKTSA